LFVILPLVVVGLVVLLSKRRRAGLVLLAVGMLFVLGLFFVGVSRSVRVENKVSVRQGPEVPLPGTYTPAIWLDDIEEQFKADVYPSMDSAAKALGRELTSLLPTVSPDNNAPAVVQVCGRVEPEKVSPDVLNAVGDSLGRENEGLKVLVETIVPDEPIERTDSRAVTVRVSLPRWGTGTIATGEDKRLEHSGTLRAHVTGAAGQLTRTVEFIEKPWVENFARFVNSNPKRQFLVARSQGSCVSEGEAEHQAMTDACEQIASQLKQMMPRDTFMVNPVDINNRRLVSDRFVQSFEGTAGRIWRQALLIDASQDKLNRLAEVKIRQTRSLRANWAQVIISVIGLTVLICVVYFFLDAATRGYYTLALRIAAVVLIAAAIVVILFLN
jgi:hypothetical protein